ncbi:MAG: 5'-methylthioadenosine/adenosylhomocysteine nucleosidase [Lachnospiraceae bacterium]|nr:5'-methylthioadenosine/adenosylhomocysteine nucleosidase [Lachnospiraceae bacterium]
MIAIIGAMESEVEQLTARMESVQLISQTGMNFYQGVLAGKDVVVVQCGVGKVNAALCTQILADRFDVSAIINTGIAGSLQAEVNIGDVVLSEDAIYHDMDVTVFGYAPGEVPGIGRAAFPADRKLIALAKESCMEANPEIGVFVGRIVSGDQFIMSREKKNWLKANFGGICTEMEGAAIAHGAWRNRIPFLIIRAISDKADDSANMTMDEFEPLAIGHTVRLLMTMLPKL